MTEAAQVDELQASINAELEQPVDPAPVEQVEDEAKAESAPAQEESVDTPAEPDGVQKRINKITADKYEEKRRADALQAKLDALQTEAPATQSPTTEPTLESCEFDDAKYQAALIDYKLDQRLKQQQQTQQQAQEQAKQAEIAKGFSSKVAEFVETAPDYEETIGAIPQLPQDTLNAVMQMDNGPQVAYYLGKHLDVADQVATMSPINAAMKLGEIRAQLANTKPINKPSAAPEPVETITSGGSVDKDMADMSMEEIYNM